MLLGRFAPACAVSYERWAAAGLLLAISTAVQAQPAMPPGFEPQVSAWVMGSIFLRRGEQSYGFYTSLSVGNRPNAGGIAAFAADDAGNVTWMGQTDYVPNQTLASAKRKFATPTPPLKGEEIPRYLMVCSWALDDARKLSGPILVGYAERDDVRTSVSKDPKVSESITVHWAPIPSARAKAKFAKADYCGEVARTKTVLAPHWLQDQKDK